MSLPTTWASACSRASIPKAHHSAGYGALFQANNRRATILASVPWFLQDLGTYGIGIFTPTILAAAVGHKHEHVQNVATLIANDLIAAKGAAFIDILLLVGIVAAVLLADRLGRIPLQVVGFVGCAVGLFIAAQIGAVTTAFLFPILLADLGTAKLLYVLVGTSLLGAVVTWLFRIEIQRLQIARRELALESALTKLDKYHLLILDDIVHIFVRQASSRGVPSR